MDRRNLEVPRAHGGEALARILHDGLGISHASAKGLIDEGCVTINGRPAKGHGQRCEAGDVVEVRYDPNRRYHPAPVPKDEAGFQILYEDKELAVVNKMPGLLSAPAPGAGEESLAEKIAASLRRRGIKTPQIFVVHRLDRDTSGLVVFAKTQRALESLAAQFESREAGRIYVAFAGGRIQKNKGTIISHLVEDPTTLSVRTTPIRGAGKRAVTHFEVLEKFGPATILRVKLETGRKHQIRVHFAEIGHALLGDKRYGHTTPLISRVALHAERLAFKHPKTLQKMMFEAPWPDDLLKLAQQLRKRSAELAAGQGALDPIRWREGAVQGPPRVAVYPKGLVLLDPIASGVDEEHGFLAGSAPGAGTPAAATPGNGIRRDTQPLDSSQGPGTKNGGNGGPPDRSARPLRADEPAMRTGSPTIRKAGGFQEGPRGDTDEARKARRLAFQRAVGNKSAFREPSPDRRRSSAPPVAPRRADEEAPRRSPAAAKTTGKSSEPRPPRKDADSGARARTAAPAGSGAEGRPAKPWEFRQKGMTLRRERRHKIAAARAKGRKR